MYEINVSTRRVTQYIIEEAYKWLYQKIKDGEYATNRCKPGKALLLQIEENHGLTQENYEEFIELFDNSPYSYMLYRSKHKSSKKITTDHLFNYFVQFNGEILPLGFVKDFFEDDYETEQEINALLQKFASSEKDEISVRWKRTLISKEDAIEGVQMAFPNMFRVHPMLLITEIIRLVVTLAIGIMVWTFLENVHFMDIMGVFMSEHGFDVGAKFQATSTMAAYCFDGRPFCMAGDAFTLGDYFGHYALFFILNIILIIVLISRVRKSISFIIFAVRVVSNKVRLLIQKVLIHNFEKDGVQSIGNYFMEVAPEMANARVIDDTHCAGIPKARNLYNAIEAFNIQKMSERLAMQMPKYFAKNYAYEEKDAKIVKATWRSGIIVSVLFTIVLAFVYIPSLSALVMPSIINFFSSIF